jgi:hypothetical protein
MARELNITARKRSKTTVIGLKGVNGTRTVEIENFDPYAFASAMKTRQESRGGTAKQRLVAKVEADLRQRGIRV